MQDLPPPARPLLDTRFGSSNGSGSAQYASTSGIIAGGTFSGDQFADSKRNSIGEDKQQQSRAKMLDRRNLVKKTPIPTLTNLIPFGEQ